jgi:hypothetical protein
VTDGNACSNTGSGSAFVNIGPRTTAAVVTNVCPGTIIEVPVTVSDFYNISAISLKLIYDKSVMTFNSFVDDSGLIDLCTADESGTDGIISISGMPGTPANLADNATLLTIKFNFISGTTNLTWDNDPDNYCEYASGVSPNFVPYCDNPDGTYYINGSVTGYPVQAAPAEAVHTPSTTQIVWNWNTVSGADGYKWSATNDFSTATNMGTSTTTTQSGLTCNTGYTSFVWAYNANCHSSATTLSSTTSACTWTGGLGTYRGNDGFQYDFVVTGTTTGWVWGGCSAESYYYTDDSALETAAVHRGFVANGQTKTVRVEIRAGLSSYSGCTANGVTSSSWSSYPGSYIIISAW